jgi:hypothetical protein
VFAGVRLNTAPTNKHLLEDFNESNHMKTDERTVYFYDLVLSAHAQFEGIVNASGADLSEILALIAKLKPLNYEITKPNSKVAVVVSDWQHDTKKGIHKILINRADCDVSDVAFRDFSSKKIRKAGKTKIEGVEYSSHIIIKPRSDNRTALMLMTMGAGVTAVLVDRMLSQLTKNLDLAANKSLFNFAHPSAQRNARGEPFTYKVKYSYQSNGHKGSALEDALTTGTFISMDLIAHEFSSFDSGGNLHVEAQSISVKANVPKLLTAAGLINAVKAFMGNKPAQQYDNARIRFKTADGSDQTTTLDTNDLDAAFTKKQKVMLDVDVESQQTKLNANIITAMEQLLQ